MEYKKLLSRSDDHGAFLDFRDVCIAAPCDIFFPAGVYTTFKCTTTLVANDSARERVAVLIFLVLLFYAFFSAV